MRTSRGPTGGCDIAESFISKGPFPLVPSRKENSCGVNRARVRVRVQGFCPTLRQSNTASGCLAGVPWGSPSLYCRWVHRATGLCGYGGNMRECKRTTEPRTKRGNSFKEL